VTLPQIAVPSAVGTQPCTVGTASRLHRTGHPESLADYFTQVEHVVLVNQHRFVALLLRHLIERGLTDGHNREELLLQSEFHFHVTHFQTTPTHRPE
jgi:hypothetical protein